MLGYIIFGIVVTIAIIVYGELPRCNKCHKKHFSKDLEDGTCFSCLERTLADEHNIKQERQRRIEREHQETIQQCLELEKERQEKIKQSQAIEEENRKKAEIMDKKNFFENTYKFYQENSLGKFDFFYEEMIYCGIFIFPDKSINFVLVNGENKTEIHSVIPYNKIHYYEKCGNIHYISDINIDYTNNNSFRGSFTGGKSSILASMVGGLLFGGMGMAIGAMASYKPSNNTITEYTSNQISVSSKIHKIDERSIILNYFSDSLNQLVDIELPYNIFNFLQTHIPEKKYDIVLHSEKNKFSNINNLQEELDVSENLIKSENIKRKKGKSLIDLIEDYVVIDIETTGLDNKCDSIIEISALKIKNNQIVDKFTSLVKPEQCTINESVVKLTGITNSMLLNAPDIKEVLSNFFEFISDKDVIIGHNVNFDINFIYDAHLKYNNKIFKNNFIDTLRLSRRILKDIKHHTLEDVANFFNISQEIKHRALADCVTTYKCYESLKQYIKENNIDLAKSSKKSKSENIITDNNEFDETNPFYKKVFAFTGTLEKLTRDEAMSLVEINGGIAGNGVTKKTNFLVIGDSDHISNKEEKAKELILKGQDLKIISENEFYNMIEY